MLEGSFNAGLTTPESKKVISSFLAWSKDDRDTAVSDCSRDLTLFRDTRIVQSNYSRAETIELLDSVTATVRAAVSASHEKLTDSVGELVRAILEEVDLQRVELSVDALKALNMRRTALSATEATAQKMLAAGRPNALAPLDAPGGGDTAKQLAQANDLIKKLREKLHAVEDQYRKVMDEKSRLQGANMYLGDQLSAEEQRLQAERRTSSANATATAAAGQKSAAELQAQIDTTRRQHEGEVAALSKKVNTLLQEQQGALSKSGQFQAMKKMLREKTEQVKKLRDLLRPYNPQAAGADDDIATDDDDD